MSKPGFPRTARVAGAASAVALLSLAAACSSSGSGSGSGSGSAKSSSPGGTSTTPPTSSSMPSTAGGTTTVTSATASVGGAQTMVLTAPDGHTLYYFTPDTAAGAPTCTGSCAALWPALKAASPTEATAVTGKLTVVSGQVAYNGHPLYEYTGDSAAGQANGEGIMGKWYVATPTLAVGGGAGGGMPSGPSSPSSPSSPSTSGGGSGGYGGY